MILIKNSNSHALFVLPCIDPGIWSDHGPHIEILPQCTVRRAVLDKTKAPSNSHNSWLDAPEGSQQGHSIKSLSLLLLPTPFPKPLLLKAYLYIIKLVWIFSGIRIINLYILAQGQSSTGDPRAENILCLMLSKVAKLYYSFIAQHKHRWGIIYKTYLLESLTHNFW